MTDDKKTPLEQAAHAIWPLDWEDKDDDLMAYMPLFGWLGFIEIGSDNGWEFHGGEVLNNLPLPDGLETWLESLTSESITPILTAARDAAAQHIREALALCEPASTVQVVRHRETEEAVLLLTDQDGDAWPVLSGQILAVREYDAGGALIRTDEPALGQVLVRESAADIRATLAMLDAEKGGEE